MEFYGDGSAAARKTVTRADLAESVCRKVGLSRVEAAVIVEMVISEIVETLAARESVKLSSFGTFLLRPKGERLGRNPKTGADAKITARWVVVFKPSNILRARINGQSAARRPRGDAPSTSGAGSCS